MISDEHLELGFYPALFAEVVNVDLVYVDEELTFLPTVELIFDVVDPDLSDVVSAQ